MINIIKRTAGLAATNSYILCSENGDCAVVDPGDEVSGLQKTLNENGLRCTAVLLTHAHFDHAGSCLELQKTGARIYMHASDMQLVETDKNLARLFGKKFQRFTPDVTVHDGDEIDILNEKINVFHTPGHTAGSVCYVMGNVIFSGDTLFRLSVGRTDFPTGSTKELNRSVKKLFGLPGDYTVYPGHGEITDLNFERENNPYA